MALRPLTWIAIGLAALAATIFLFVDPGVEDGITDLPVAVTNEVGQSAEALDEPVVLSRPSEARAPIAEPGARLHVRGTVLDLGGSPVAHVDVGVDGRSERAFSDFFGEFELLVARGALHRELEVVGERLIALRTSAVAEDRELLLVVCPSLTLAGKIVDGTGAALSGALVSVELSDDPFDFPRSLDETSKASKVARSDAEGRFQLEVPAVTGKLWAILQGYVAASLELPESDRSDLELVLRRMDTR